MRTGSPSSDEPSAGPARVPEAVLAGVEAHLRQRELRRDELHQRARRLRRAAQGAMGRLHEGRTVPGELDGLRATTTELATWLREAGRGDEGLALDALQESAEALLLDAVVRGVPLPGPTELGIDPEPYLLGLGDTAGEVRRLALDRLAAGDVEGAEAHLRTLDHLVRTLMRFDTTRAIVALKPKQDVARSLLERTRGDVTMARMLQARNAPGSERR